MIFAFFHNPLQHKSAFAQIASDSWRGLQPLEPRLLLSGSPTHLADVLPVNGGDGTSGFVATGIEVGDQSGTSATVAGDINGDEVDDLIIGAPSAGAAAGEVYVVYGSSSGFPAAVDLGGLNGIDGFRLNGSAAEQAGFSVSSAGDVNNDQFDDLIIGSPASDPKGRANAGSAYIVFGGTNLAGTIDLSELNGMDGFRLDGAAAGDRAGVSVAKAGDVNNDGFSDVIIGATGADPDSRTNAGSAYVVLGSVSFAATIELSSLNGANGFRLDGATMGDEFGISVSSAGDVNNDNFDDVVVGAPGADPSNESAAGSAYVFFGATSFSDFTNVTALNGASGFRMDGVDEKDRAGQSVAGDGDVNGDGFSDVIIGSPRAKVDGVSVGAAYVFFGKSGSFAPSVSLGTVDGTTGFRLAGDYESDPLLSSFIVNTTGLTSRDIAGQNTSRVENAMINFTSVIPDDHSVYAHSSGIPAEVIGPWSGNPNTVTDQDRTHQIPRSPTEEPATKIETGLGSTGVWIDGVAIFNWSDARSYRNQGAWNQNAVYWEGPGLDSYGAHPPPFGEYHTHAMPTGLIATVGDDGSKHSPILGWSYDGFPIYGPWGYANIDGSGGIERMESSWKLRDITTRTHYADGTNVADGPAVATVPLGAYLEDHKYVNNLGDLDQHNGRFSVTPEYPEGVYHYHVTIDTNGSGVFPYVIGIEYYGVVETANTIGQGGNVGNPTATDIFVSYVRDHNGDGFDDPAFGDPDGYVSGSNVAGKAHVFYGKRSGFAADMHLHGLDGTDGFHIEGVNHHDHTGHVVGSADVNGDGAGDLIISAHDADPHGNSAAGQTFVVFGNQTLLLGDANNDGLVTGLDLIAVQQNFGTTGLSDGLLHGDANDDGLVTGLDLIVVQQNFGHVPTPSVGEEPNDLPTATAGTDTRTFTTTITGTKYDDFNGNGQRDSGEPGLEGWAILLSDTNSNPIATTITDTHGNYGFSEIEPDTFTASEQLQAGYVQTAPMNPGTHTITTSRGQNIDGLDFGNQANNISAVNDPPVAVPDSLTVTKGKTATILDSGAASVLDNDIDDDDSGLAPVLDADEIGWSAVDNLTNDQFAENVAAHKNQNLLVDIEVYEDDGQPFISGVWQQNVDSRLWAEHHNLTSGQFSDLWLQYHGSGYRLIDQEAYALNGQWYYAGIWIENLEGYAWVSYQNTTNSEFSDQIDEYEGGYILSDFDAYTVDNSTRYAHLWVENTQMLQWKLHRDMTAVEFSHFSRKYKRSYRIHDIESYQIDGQQYYAAIWIENRNGRSWVDLRDADTNNYKNHWIHYRDLGYRLTDFEKYETSDGVRYVGVWRQNTDRPDWYMRSEIDATADAHLAEHGIPGMGVAIAHQGEIKYMRGFGHQDIAENRWYSAHTINRLASVSKAVGGVLLLKLADQDQIDPLALTRDYAPELPIHHTHTLEQLASNRAGVGHYSQLGLGTIYTQYDTALEASALFWNEDLVSAPGASYYYSTHGYTLLGAGIEGATGQAIADVIYNELGSGLGLTTLKAEDRSIENEFRTKLYNTNNT